MLHSQTGRRFCRQIIQFDGCNALVDARDDFLRHLDRIHKLRIEAVAQLADA